MATVVSELGVPEMSILNTASLLAAGLCLVMGVIYVIKNGFLHGLLQMLVVAVILSVPVAVLALVLGRSPEESPEVQPSRANVEVITAKRGTMVVSVELPMVADCVEDCNVTLGAEVPGRVVWVGKNEGDKVTKGEAIIKVDTEALKAQLKEVEAGRKEALLRYNRVKNLFEGKHSSQEVLEGARAGLDRLVAQSEQISVTMRQATVRSPLDGKIEKRYVAFGKYVKIGESVADVVNIDRLYAVVDIPERYRERAMPGLKVSVRFDNARSRNPGTPFVYEGAVVRSVSEVADSLTRTFRAQVEFDNNGYRVKPGMLGTVRFESSPITGFVLVPRDFIVPKENDKLVYVVEDGKVVARTVSLGYFDGEKYVVHSGVAEGDLLIRNPRAVSPGELATVRSIDGKTVRAGEVPTDDLGKPGGNGRGTPDK